MEVIKKLLISFLFLSLLIVSNCEKVTSPANSNIPPNTTIANIPVENDTLFALLTLHWDGGDNDGYIEGYEYRYITHHKIAGDSIVQPWIETNNSSVMIPFESSDILNYQIFQVRAIDDKGDVDPTPAERRFYTVQTIFPEAEIIFPKVSQQFFVMEQTTDWWNGIKLDYTAYDEDGTITEYAWAVDDGEWNWTNDTTLFITPEYFQPLNGEHKIRVTSRDNTNLVDPIGDSITVKLITATFEKDLLIVDETIESKFPSGMSFSDEDVDSFYYRIFEPDSIWDFNKNGMPSKEILGQYKLVVWHADNLYSNENDVHELPVHIVDIMDYMNVGGDFIMSGWRILKSFAVSESFPKTFEEGTFIHDYLHILQAEESVPIPDFNGAYSNDTTNFSDVRVDSLKLTESFLTSVPTPGLPYVNLMPRRAGFTEVIYRYKNDEATGIGTYRGYACGIRYYGTVFDAVVLGFPMFFINEDDAAVMADEMLISLGY